MSKSRVQLGDIDLNSLVHLHELLESASVSKAAEQLGVTQSAMSHMLRRLRQTFDDPLLVRERQGMARTPRAEALREPLYHSLLGLQDTLTKHQRFVPAASKRRFRVAMSDYLQTVLLPGLVEVISREAPEIELQVEGLGVIDRIMDRLLSGELDLATGGPLLEVVPGVECELLCRDRLWCAVRRDHPKIGERLELADYLAFPHMLISPRGYGESSVDMALAGMGHRRRVAVRVQSFVSALFLLRASDNLLTAPERVLRAYADALDLRLLEPPIDLPGFEITLLWSRHERHDAALAWLRGVYIRVCEQLT